MTPKCPNCRGNRSKVIYFGLPGLLCDDPTCNTLSGLASWAPNIGTETPSGTQFAFMKYRGSYWPALWAWLRGELP